MRHIIRTVVRRIEIDDTRIEIIFRVPPPDGPPGVEVARAALGRIGYSQDRPLRPQALGRPHPLP
jgi:hypothetical protein